MMHCLLRLAAVLATATAHAALATAAEVAAVAAAEPGTKVPSGQPATGTSPPPSPTPSPPQANTTKRRVVFHQDHGHQHLPHHHSPWEIEMGLVVVLVAVHFVALSFWMYLLYSAKGQKRTSRGGAKWGITTKAGSSTSDQATPSKVQRPGSKGGSMGGASGGGAASTGNWRTPGEILAAYKTQAQTQEKHRLGKV